MGRQSPQVFRCQPLEALCRQLLFAPPEKRIRQVRRAERLHDQIEPDRSYPVEFLVYRITGYRRDGSDSLLLVGEAVLPDLRLLIDQLSRSVRMKLDEDEQAESAEELAERLGVSCKTITRWRKLGLRWRWAAGPGGSRRRLVYPASGVACFMERHGPRVERASRFSHIPPEMRRQILSRARRIAQARDVSLNQVAAHLSKKTGRALETIRLILEKHDHQNPQQPIFADRTGPLTIKQKRIIERAHRMGVSTRRIALRFGRTYPTIYRAIKERRAARARRVVLDCVRSPIFDREDAEVVLLRAGGDDLQSTLVRLPTVVVNDLPEALQRFYRQRGIEPRQLRSLFVRYNYLKHRAAAVREGFDRYEPRVAELDRFDALVREASRLEAHLFRAHLPVVLSVTRRHQMSAADRSPQGQLKLLELGNTVLLEAVRSFNATRNRDFDSYLTNKLLQRFASDGTAAGDGEARVQARRRVKGEQILQRMLLALREAGIELADDGPLKPSDQDD